MGKATMAQRCEIIFSPKEGADPERTSSLVFVKVAKLKLNLENLSGYRTRITFVAPNETAIKAVLEAIEPLVSHASLRQ